MESLTSKKIMGIQSRIIQNSKLQEDTGWDGDVLYSGTLEFLVTEGNKITDPYRRAAWFLHGIASKHVFFQGNKRTALVVAENILILSEVGAYICADDKITAEFVEQVGSYVHTVDAVEEWLRANTKKFGN